MAQGAKVHWNSMTYAPSTTDSELSAAPQMGDIQNSSSFFQTLSAMICKTLVLQNSILKPLLNLLSLLRLLLGQKLLKVLIRQQRVSRLQVAAARGSPFANKAITCSQVMETPKNCANSGTTSHTKLIIINQK